MSGILKTSVASAAAAETDKKPKLGKSGKKICCSCPQTKTRRDECIAAKGIDACAELIEAHKKCLRAEGFDVK